MSKRYLQFAIYLVIYTFGAMLLPGCNPEAPWATEDVIIQMKAKTVSAGFAEYSFSTNKEAYYLIACEPVDEEYDPMTHQKQFMMMALDSACASYIHWRNYLLRKGEFNVAPFASHSLQYGNITHFFTGLWPNKEYWVYAFVVNPETLKPIGKLYIDRIRTTEESIMDIHFDYRIKGGWDYIYPLDSANNVYTRFPYIATTRDSLTLAENGFYTDKAIYAHFVLWCAERFFYPEDTKVLYGVHAVNNDGIQSGEIWQEGHTYYTVLSGYDGSFRQTTIYKFVWTGEDCNLYFRDTDSANIVNWWD